MLMISDFTLQVDTNLMGFIKTDLFLAFSQPDEGKR